jgi:hypothetical protein
MIYIWLIWFELLIHVLVLGGLLPYLFSQPSNELNILGYLVIGLLITKDYSLYKFVRRTFLKKEKKNEKN